MSRPAAALALAAALGAAPAGADPTVVLLLFDGFSPHRLELADTPALDRMRREGAWTHALVPAFPTISLINGVTVSTGCWPAHHGIVSNVFLDPERGRYDHSRDADWLTGCEHLHQVAERQGVAAAAVGWYGGRSASRGKLATWVEPGGCGPTLEASAEADAARAARLVELLGRGPGDGPRLLLGYFCGPDGAEHFEGMESEAARADTARSDAVVGRVLEAIEARPDADEVTLLVTTDHGMRRVTHVVNLARILASHGIEARAVSSGTTSLLYFDDPGPGAVDAAAEALAAYEPLDVLRPGALPDWAHLGDGPRVGDLVVSARPPYFIEDVELWPGYLRWLAWAGPKFVWARFSLKATHGYPPHVEGMHGILYAWGAGIAPGREAGPVENVHIHPTVTHLLGIEPGRPVDGRVADALLERREP